jgi:hypothetical protein
MSDSNEGGGGMNWMGIIIGAVLGLILGKSLIGGLMGAVAGEVAPGLLGGLLGGGDNSQGGGIMGLIGGFLKKLFGGKSQDQSQQTGAPSAQAPQAPPSQGYDFNFTAPPTPPTDKSKGGQGSGYQF